MQAVRFHQPGGPDVLVVDRVPVPEPGPGEVLLKIKAASVNHLDIWLRSGTLPAPLPHTLGCDGAGTVAGVGDGVTGLAVGDPCLIFPGMGCGNCPHCAAGAEQLCPAFTIFGTSTPGAYAEYAVLPARNLIPLPAGVDFPAAATLGVAGVTAWHLLVTRARVREGETVLIHGAGSGLGSFAIQVARHFGAKVIATAGNDAKCGQAMELGAATAINYTTALFDEAVREATVGGGADVVFDHVGAEVFDRNMAVLATGGRLITCGTTTGGDVSLNLRDLFSGQKTILGGRLGGSADLTALLAEVAAGHITPVIDTVYPLDEATAAHARMEARNLFGKLVLTMP